MGGLGGCMGTAVPVMMVVSPAILIFCKGCQQLNARIRVTEAEGSSIWNYMGGGSTADVRTALGDAGMSGDRELWFVEYHSSLFI